METQPVKQAWGSPGGKSYLAERIVKMMPEHTTYVEPFAGGAAVYFNKAKSDIEILNDKDEGISSAFKFIRDMTPEQFEKLKKYDWVKRKSLFDNLKASNPKSDIEKFRRWYYLRKGSFALKGQNFNTGAAGTNIDVDKLWKVHERLNKTKIFNEDARTLIGRYDGKNTLFYLDPPYPGRASVATGGSFDEEDLKQLIDKCHHVKGKVIFSINKEYEHLFPEEWSTQKVKVERKMVPSQTGQITKPEYEIIATNMRNSPHISRSTPRISRPMPRISPRSPRITPKTPRLR